MEKIHFELKPLNFNVEFINVYLDVGYSFSSLLNVIYLITNCNNKTVFFKICNNIVTKNENTIQMAYILYVYN